tara:strand:+ start:8573 stop:8698 length:126 start_codon:yes stop_codon:yes gene_type:complete
MILNTMTIPLTRTEVKVIKEALVLTSRPFLNNIKYLISMAC